MDLQALLIPLMVAMGLNWFMFIPAYLFKTDKLTDISYSLTFLILVCFAFWNSQMSMPQTVLLTMIILWAIRLGGYLFYRIHKMGHDTRFDEMRNSAPRFFGFWTLQGITVFIVSIPFLLGFQNEMAEFVPLQYVGLVIFALGLLIESIADWQKFQSKIGGNKLWVDNGLWSNIRHPNYLGEILAWLGVYLFTAPHLSITGQLIAFISPLFIFLMLRYVSGITLLEESHSKKWGDMDEYRSYKDKTGLLLPKF